MHSMQQSLRLACLGCLVFLAGTANALDHVTFRHEGKSIQISGQVLVEPEDGGLLLVDRAGTLWAITSEELEGRRKDEAAFKPFDEKAMAEHLLREVSANFRIHTTAHYVIGYNTSPEYAKWCGALFERLYLAFCTFWRESGIPLQDPPSPLVALVFDGKDAFARYSRAELGEATPSIFGYYSLRTNRVTMYDLTGADAARGRVRTTSAEHINRVLSRPQAERTVATIIHEATHQLAFNCGLLTRYADIPLWVSEGIAIYFETPDLQSKRGWRNIGGVNQVRLAGFRQHLPRRPQDSLLTLISRDDRFRRTDTAGDAYGEAWALNYFLLLRGHRDRYVQYLKGLSQKQPLIYDEPEDRVQQFKAAFGENLEKLNADFLRYMSGVR